MNDERATNASELDNLLHGSAFAIRADRSFLRVSGSDAVRWLNGMVTNSTGTLAEGEGNYNFLLNAQGRIQGDCLLYREVATADSPVFLLLTDGAQTEAIQAHLDRYIIMDDVELTPVFTEQPSLFLIGAEAPQQLGRIDLPTPGPLHLVHADTPHGPVLLFAPSAGAVPRFELRAAPATLSALQNELSTAEVPELSAATLEQLRIWEGQPRFGVDIRDRELPQETNQTHALHFAKGCYLGQEIVERIRSRGQVHRIFTALRLEGTPPLLPAPLDSGGKSAGEITSAAEITLEGRSTLLALGYVRREVLDTRAALTYAGGTAHPRTLPRADERGPSKTGPNASKQPSQ